MRRDLLEFEHPLRVRTFVNTEDHRHARRLEVRRHGLIRGQHELLDETVRDVARRARHARHLAEFVEFEQRLGKIEVDRPPAGALAVQDRGQLLHGLEARLERRVTLT